MQIVPLGQIHSTVSMPYSIHSDTPELVVFWQMVQRYAQSALTTKVSQCKTPRHNFPSKSEIIVFTLCNCLLLLVPGAARVSNGVFCVVTKRRLKFTFCD